MHLAYCSHCPSSVEQAVTVTGPSSLIDLGVAGQQGIEVAEANPGLCAILENAALLYANGQAVPARAVLSQGVVEDPDAKTSPLAWLALLVARLRKRS